VTGVQTCALPILGVIPTGLLRAVGLVHRDTRELAEMAFQFTAPFVLDSTASEERLGLKPTPFDDAIRETAAWWRLSA